MRAGPGVCPACSCVVVVHSAGVLLLFSPTISRGQTAHKPTTFALCSNCSRYTDHVETNSCFQNNYYSKIVSFLEVGDALQSPAFSVHNKLRSTTAQRRAFTYVIS